jgi:hypothetical protein
MESVRRVPCPRANMMSGRWGLPLGFWKESAERKPGQQLWTRRPRETRGMATCIYDRLHSPVPNPSVT